MKRLLLVLFIGMVVSMMACGSLWAQATAQISGAVQDQSGAVLPGVEITATQTETGVSRMTVTNETGFYTLPNLAVGPYRLEATLPGFRSFVQTGIVLQVGSNPTLNVILQVGQVSEQVEVQANASLVETRTLSVGQVMETSRIMELPLNGRNAQELLLLGGGTVQAAPVGGQSYPGRLMISGAGAMATATEYSLDGIGHVSPFDAFPLPLPFPDALAEFKTEIGGQTASAGRGSQVSAVTKSGTNDFHGDLFEFVRNDLFNARQYFSSTNSSLKRNQFGGTAGGAVIKNKLFFFGGYQATILRQDPADRREFVPSAAMLAGDFTAFANTPCQRRAVTLKAPFVGNRVDPALFSPVALKVAARLPKTNNPCGEITYGRKNINDQHEYISKVDYQSSDKHSLFTRVLHGRVSTPSPYEFTPDIPMNAVNKEEARAWAVTAGSTYLLSSTTVNSFRIAFTRTSLNTETPRYFDISELGSKVYTGFAPGMSSMEVVSGFSLSGQGVRVRAIDLYQIADDVSMTHGTHQFGFGGRVANSRTIVTTSGDGAPTFNFAGGITGLGLADFLLGKPSDFLQGAGNAIYTRVNYLSMFAQDTWQVKPRLSMSYGVRWAPVLPHHDVRRPVPFVLQWDPERFRQGLRSTTFVNAPPGILFVGDPGFGLKNNGLDAEKPQANIFNAYWTNFAPRLGFAWDVEGNGRTSVRASYGLSFQEYPTVDRLGTQQGMPPYGSVTRVLEPAGGLDDPWRGVPGGNPFPLTANRNMPFVPFGEYLFRVPDLTPTYTQTWNLSLQREVVPGALMTASYIGSHTVHLQVADPINPAIYIPGVGNAGGNCFLNGQATPYKVAPGAACSTIANTQDRRVLSFVNPAVSNEIGRAALIANGGTQQYHGMLLSTQYRKGNINLGGNYTLSHCVGDYSARTNTAYGTSTVHTYQDPHDRKRDRGNCEIDQRHTLNVTAVGETPRFVNRTLNVIGSGWRVSGIYRLSTSGTIINPSQAVGIRTVTLGAQGGSQTSAAGGDQCLCDILNQRPDLLLPDAVYLDKSGRPGTQWLNPAAFGVPALGTLGNLGRANIKLPNSWQFDVALARVFRFRETQNIEFRAEAYNVLNSFRTGAITTDFSSGQFGRIRNALDPRILQFALKYAF
jgi:hypothetical protein